METIPSLASIELDKHCLLKKEYGQPKSAEKECGQATLESFFDYHYLKKKGQAVLPPSEFENAKDFCDQMEGFFTKHSLSEVIQTLRKNRILVFLAPGVCQA